MKNRLSPIALVGLAALTGSMACDFQHRRGSASPSAVTSGSSDTGSALVGNWSSQSAGGGSEVPDLQGCANFQWNVSSQTSTGATGTFSISCLGGITLAGNATGQMTGASVQITLSGSANLPGFGACPFSIGGTGALIDPDTLRVPYTGNTCLGTVSGTETLRRNLIAPTPPPAPAPPAPPPPAPPAPPPPAPAPPPPGASDAIDLHQVTVQVGVNIADWPITSVMTGGTYNGVDTLCTYHTKAGQWPVLPFFDTPATVEGNQWVFANINGRWYGGAGEWLRPGQQCKGVPPNVGPDTFYNGPAPINSWIPRPGELVGLAVSTPARAGQWGIAERSNVILIRW